MDAGKFAAMLSDKHSIDLKRMQHKYSIADVVEFIELLTKNLFKKLSLWDFDGKPLVFLENRVQVSMASARVLLTRPSDTHRLSTVMR